MDTLLWDGVSGKFARLLIDWYVYMTIPLVASSSPSKTVGGPVMRPSPQRGSLVAPLLKQASFDKYSSPTACDLLFPSPDAAVPRFLTRWVRRYSWFQATFPSSRLWLVWPCVAPVGIFHVALRTPLPHTSLIQAVGCIHSQPPPSHHEKHVLCIRAAEAAAAAGAACPCRALAVANNVCVTPRQLPTCQVR